MPYQSLIKVRLADDVNDGRGSGCANANYHALVAWIALLEHVIKAIEPIFLALFLK